MNHNTRQWLESFPEGREYDLHLSVRNQETKQRQNAMNLNPMLFATLAQLAHDSPILCIEGTLVSLYEPKRGDGNYGPWVIQNGVISDGQLRHDISFMSDETIVSMDAKNKKIRITAQEYKSKLAGIKLTEKAPKGKTEKKRCVEVRFPAKVEVFGGQPSGQPSSQPAQRQPQQTQAPANPSVNGGQQTMDHGDEPSSTNEPMEDRIADWMRTLDLVCDAVGHNRDTVLEGLSPDKVAEITTGFILSFKGKFSTHARPFFRGDEGQATAQKQEELVQRAAQATQQDDHQQEEDVPNWRDFTYRNNSGQQRLGDKTEEQIRKIHAFCQQNPAPETADLAKNVSVALAEIEASKAGSYRDGMADDDVPWGNIPD